MQTGCNDSVENKMQNNSCQPASDMPPIIRWGLTSSRSLYIPFGIIFWIASRAGKINGWCFRLDFNSPHLSWFQPLVSWRENKCLSSGFEEETRWMIMDRNSLRPKSYSSTDQPPKKCKIPASPAKVVGQKFCPKMYSEIFCHILAKDVLSH